MILVVALWENDETPERAVTAGFEAFASELRVAVAQRLLPLSSSNQEEREQAIVDIGNQVNGRVNSAIRGALSLAEKARVLAGLLDLDDVVGTDTTTVATLPDPSAPRPLSLAFGVDQGGRLLFYRDQTQNGTGDVANPAVIGLGGWQDFKFLFSGGNGIIYAVDQDGRLLFYRDQTQNGTGDVANPAVIGLGGWQNFKFLFSGGNGIIYAVDQDGRLLFYRDQTQNGTGDVANPAVIGLGGWQDFKFLFSGGNGIIYAVDQDGRLLFYRDQTQNGTGDVANPAVIGLGGWQDFKFLFSGGNGIIYAVDQDGRLLFYRDQTQNGTGDVANPAVIGLGGWQDFKFLFSGGNGIIYAVDKLVQEPNRYEIEGHLEVQAPTQIAFSHSSLDFGLLGIGEVATRTLRISSNGVAPVTVTVSASTGGVLLMGAPADHAPCRCRHRPRGRILAVGRGDCARCAHGDEQRPG